MHGIDVHCHYAGGTLSNRFIADFTPAGGFRIPPDWEVQACLDFMDSQEIAAQILSAPWCFNDPKTAPLICRTVNEEYAEIIRAHPQRFGAFAALPANSPDSALAEISYALDTLGLDGIMLPTNAHGRYLTDPLYTEVLAELDRREVPVFLHPADGPHTRSPDPTVSTSAIELVLDTARSVALALYAGIFHRHPNLKIIVAHCGGALPSLTWRLSLLSTLPAMGAGPETSPAAIADCMRRFYYDTTLSAAPQSLLPVLQITDRDHLLFGTDFPGVPSDTATANTEMLSSTLGLTAKETSVLLARNAGALFPRLIQDRSKATAVSGPTLTASSNRQRPR